MHKRVWFLMATIAMGFSISLISYHLTIRPDIRVPQIDSLPYLKSQGLSGTATVTTSHDPASRYNGTRSRNHKGYLIYRCSHDDNCSGFADRQKAIVGVYALALMTNRTFGVIMTSPVPLIDFYEPNKVDWNIPMSELKGKTSIAVKCITQNEIRTQRCNEYISHVDLNDKYPQEVVYLQSRMDILAGLIRSPLYKHRLPAWASNRSTGFARGWMHLMKPSKLLRQEVNGILIPMVKAVIAEDKTKATFVPSACLKSCNTLRNGGHLDQNSKDTFIAKCLTDEDFPSSRMAAGLINPGHRNDTDKWRKICESGQLLKQAISANDIRRLREYDALDFNLVCVHVRMGYSATIPHDQIRTTSNDIVALWKFLRSYFKLGRHIYLATDSEAIRKEGKSLFGDQIHVNSEPITHVNIQRDNQDDWLGMKTALAEQLLMMTSCHTLVVSKSGFSRRAACIRSVLVEGDGTYDTLSLSRGRVVELERKRFV